MQSTVKQTKAHLPFQHARQSKINYAVSDLFFSLLVRAEFIHVVILSFRHCSGRALVRRRETLLKEEASRTKAGEVEQTRTLHASRRQEGCTDSKQQQVVCAGKRHGVQPTDGAHRSTGQQVMSNKQRQGTLAPGDNQEPAKDNSSARIETRSRTPKLRQNDTARKAEEAARLASRSKLKKQRLLRRKTMHSALIQQTNHSNTCCTLRNHEAT